MPTPAADDFSTIKSNLERIKKENDEALKRDNNTDIPKVQEPEYYGGEYCDRGAPVGTATDAANQKFLEKYARDTTFGKGYADHNKKPQDLEQEHPYHIWFRSKFSRDTFKSYELNLDENDRIILTYYPTKILLEAFKL